VQKTDLGKEMDKKFEEAKSAMIDLFKEGLASFSYEFVLKKRLLKRLWGILISEIQNAEAYLKKFPESMKA
jgi:glycerol-3-phosphate O-acyltransferase